MRQGNGCDTEGTERGQVEQHLSQRGRAGSKAYCCDNLWFSQDRRSTGGLREVKGARVGGRSGMLEVKIISL